MELLRVRGGLWRAAARLLMPPVAALCLSVPASASASGDKASPLSDALSAQDRRLIEQSLSMGAALHAFDRAASLSTAALLKRMNRTQLAGEGGHVIERGAGGLLRVTHYHGEAADGRAFFVAHIANGAVSREELLPLPVPLSERQSRLAAAREAAARAALDHGYAPCTSAPFRSVVLPIEGDAHAVYLLSPQSERSRYPVGGHYRIVIGADGQMQSSRPFSAGCLTLDIPTLPPAARPAGLVTSNRLDNVPPEIFVFIGRRLAMPLYVMTRDQRLWKVGADAMELQAVD